MESQADWAGAACNHESPQHLSRESYVVAKAARELFKASCCSTQGRNNSLNPWADLPSLYFSICKTTLLQSSQAASLVRTSWLNSWSSFKIRIKTHKSIIFLHDHTSTPTLDDWLRRFIKSENRWLPVVLLFGSRCEYKSATGVVEVTKKRNNSVLPIVLFSLSLEMWMRDRAATVTSQVQSKLGKQLARSAWISLN